MDTAGWAEGWEKLSGRIWEGFEAIAKEMEANGGGNALVVSQWNDYWNHCLFN